ncbi:glycosyltransferase family 39 protein [Derxia gummosa]|uniref:Glycosyltransferase family 39 protein n=1 Tax=Derxia gummosa DSM 723 TaxID=1121388 RepID=A0A8B6X132_9BURK|nr:glycosyltransferase family 39 protein [Derxia gummosa]
MSSQPAPDLASPLLAATPDRHGIARLLALCLGAHLLLWAVLPAAIGLNSPWDNIEELVWSRTLELGYYKHPPLPSWVMHGLVTLFGPSPGLTFFAGAGCVAIALAFVWKLGCELRDGAGRPVAPALSLATVLLASLAAYHNLRGLYFNHNVAQLPSLAAAFLFFHRALRLGRRRDWIALGAACGIALLTKYSATLFFASFAALVAWERRLGEARLWRGIALATAVMLVVLAPHLAWGIAHDFPTLRYVEHSVGDMHRMNRFVNLWGFVSTQIVRLLPVALGLGLVHWLGRRSATAEGHAAVRGDDLAADRAALLCPSDRRFVLAVGLGPLIITLALALFGGMFIDSPWASMYFLLAGWLAVLAWPRGGAKALDLGRVLKVVAAIQVALAVGYLLGNTLLPSLAGHRGRSNFPGETVSRAAVEAWNPARRGPLRVVVGDTWLAGNIAIHRKPVPAVFIDADPLKAPWTGDADVAGCGALVVIDDSRTGEGGDLPDPRVVALFERGGEHGEFTAPWGGRKARPVRVRWAVVEPEPGRVCRLTE